MRLEQLRSVLERQLDSSTMHRAFCAGRAHHPALVRFERADEVIACLHTRDIEQRDFRSDVTAALIAEAQRRRCSFWHTLLLLAYFPGLLGIRATMKASAGIAHDELDAMLIECFLRTVSTLPLATQGRLAVVNLVLGTRKAVWQRLARETKRAKRERSLTDRAEQVAAGEYPSPERIALACEADRLLEPAFVQRWVEHLLSDEAESDVKLVVDSYLSGKALNDWVRERGAGLSQRELAREYSRLRRRRSRLLERARERIAESPLSQNEFRSALFLRDLENGSFFSEAHP